jgi:excisionase family DNA binding protein
MQSDQRPGGTFGMGQTQSTKRLLRVEEAADFLNIKPSTVRAWVLKRKLPIVHVGERAVRIPLEALERLVVENTVPAREARNGR